MKTTTLLTLLLSATNAIAVDVPVLNFSFENPGTAPNTFTGGMNFGPANWQVYNTGNTDGDRYFGVWNPTGTTSYLDPIHGSNIGVVFLQNTTNIAEAGLRQTLGITLQPNTAYTLTVDVGNFAPQPGPFEFTGFPGYRVDLLAGNTLLASDNNTLAPGEGRFLTTNVVFDAPANHAALGQSVVIRLVNLNGPGTEVNFDNVRMDASPVPEPVGMVALAGGVLLLVRRRIIRVCVPPTSTVSPASVATCAPGH
jgi:hapalindole H/12-epi-hapalindole U/12-epi-fischerindole U synthase